MKSVCVFAGSSKGVSPAYAEAARALGKEIAKRNLKMVYGGGNIGLMGECAQAAFDGGSEVVGVIPERLVYKEISGQTVGETRVVKDMHERKALMAELSDGFICLPGGWGTLEEAFEMATWQQLGYHNKPIGLLNIGNYYDGLHQFIQHVASQGFIRDTHKDIMQVEGCPASLLTRLEEYVAPEDIVTIIRSESQGK
ncbi:cytokinin riboside 5'-monophosphate phosphoribohydrolase [Chloropicon primus]|uniref:Cytokinin riboside 5'-monophosphate phosphoribohydrolase n=1 Tax=Chloropicon primus TaxID=1764295 RepID=A0A5B8MYT5_9CHLO|nr:cytokinin riboside 5'-monophosphate phosphoribohydrolase [Chloropicon primus]UPR04905.1 cytokinin riboside 5'-monophosphate phosphoribohydrolase [Chloropicon primus]|mmetsp:Transcript_2554/g.7051  ORF Transcript_2554/g.7051 Transcript_2554/m.7051 type:complete len:197 (+) Transcript_2554:133-723(+)|eukprot:QDZ25709.1 cytokinin riboside 5'-monophosphate phosphoribohydrolase [Chloropicon primus]